MKKSTNSTEIMSMQTVEPLIFSQKSKNGGWLGPTELAHAE